MRWCTHTFCCFPLGYTEKKLFCAPTFLSFLHLCVCKLAAWWCLREVWEKHHTMTRTGEWKPKNKNKKAKKQIEYNFFFWFRCSTHKLNDCKLQLLLQNRILSARMFFVYFYFFLCCNFVVADSPSTQLFSVRCCSLTSLSILSHRAEVEFFANSRCELCVSSISFLFFSFSVLCVTARARHQLRFSAIHKHWLLLRLCQWEKVPLKNWFGTKKQQQQAI